MSVPVRAHGPDSGTMTATLTGLGCCAVTFVVIDATTANAAMLAASAASDFVSNRVVLVFIFASSVSGLILRSVIDYLASARFALSTYRDRDRKSTRLNSS